MRQILSPSYVMGRDSQRATVAFTVVAVLVALAMFTAAAGAGPEEPATDRSLPEWFHVGANVLAIVYGILVLIPRTRALGALFAVANMLLSMYVNYQFGGVDFFVDAIAYNTGTIMLGSILIGHYIEDLARPPSHAPHPTRPLTQESD